MRVVLPTFSALLGTATVAVHIVGMFVLIIISLADVVTLGSVAPLDPKP